jgi:polyisoprenoid-binding protein YceI
MGDQPLTQETAMRPALIVLTLALLSQAAPILAAEDDAGTYKIDPTHSNATFTLTHLGVSRFTGRFDNVNGSFVVAGKDSRISAEVGLDQLNTGLPKREEHLKSTEYFDAARFPTLTFNSTSVKLDDQGDGTVSGELGIHGVTRPVTFKVRHIGAGKDPWGRFRSGYLATAAIKRSDWGMNTMLGALGDAVDLSISIEGIRQ